MRPDSLRSVYFLGIGGIGMSALARYFSQKGVSVSGYDRTPSALTDQLKSEGMVISFNESPENIPDNIDLLIYTPAIPKDHPVFRYFLGKGTPMRKRAEVLGMISGKYKTIAVAGTHGKTTTSTLIAHLLKTADIKMLAFLGGISKNYETNFLNSAEVENSAGDSGDQTVYCVAEADEYDKSFLQLNPYLAIITSADADHMDIYRNHESLRETFADFTSNIIEKGSLIMKLGTPVTPLLHGSCRDYSYSLDQEANFFARNIRLKDGLLHFDCITGDTLIHDLMLGVPGLFNLENAIAAIGVGHLLGIDHKHISQALKSYQGVQRRFDFRIKRQDFVYIDDYAHHPEELKACISAVRKLFPDKQITGIFQPHLFSRTRDLADAFARSLELLDRLVLLEIYPAREKPIPGVDSRMLLDKVNLKHKKIVSKDHLIREITEISPEVLLTLGAGDIDHLVEPLTMAFRKEAKKT